ncbi:MAG: hypothetical protein U1F44_04225, partial [Coriobacteriia bacterium]|nr:hypothetical protein [Coriobacteriia bacterium]
MRHLREPLGALAFRQPAERAQRFQRRLRAGLALAAGTAKARGRIGSASSRQAEVSLHEVALGGGKRATHAR